jgi:glycerol-3-phosphate acyltransferase PlsY
VAIEFGLLTLGAYLLGSMPAAYLAARWFRGIDIRQFGTGNVGASNLLRLTSKRIAIPVIIFDVGKGALMVWTAQLLGLDITQQVTVGLAAIIGHNWPVFLRFNGGRGILTTLGIVFILVSRPWLGLIILIIAYGMAPFRLLALGTIIAVASLPIFSWFLPQLFGIEKPLPITLGFVVIFLLVVIRRLTARRTIFTASVTLRQLLVNRLLFDRDIRDRKAWIDRRPSEQQGKQGKG